jgi:AMME syndrome candidate gene 1 protein
MSAESITAREHHALFCFDTLVKHVHKSPPDDLTEHLRSIISTEGFKPTPMFVTWNIIDGERHVLRGCIGTFSERPIQEGLREFALTASQRDSRFPPIRARDIGENLHCAVSLLHSFENASSWDDWEVGLHGISVSFVLHSKYFSATFLPEVAEEQQWNCETTMIFLIQKAGCGIDRDEAEIFVYTSTAPHDKVPLQEVLQSMQVERYQSSKCSTTFARFKEYNHRISKR